MADIGGSNIIVWEKIEQKIRDWVHENPENIWQIRNRTMIVAESPVFIGFAIGIILILIIEIGGRL